MSQPLSPRSDSALNISTPKQLISGNAKSPATIQPTLRQETRRNSSGSTGVASTTSSPFQTDVGSNNGMSAVPKLESTFSQPKSATKRSPSKPFTIFEDASSKATPQVSHEANLRTSSISISPSKVALPESPPSIHGTPSPIRSSPLKEYTAAYDDYDDTFDIKSTVSDDTCFSNFSAVPNADMTRFAKLGERTPSSSRSPQKVDATASETPSRDIYATPATSRRHHFASSRDTSPTPRRRRSNDGNDTTNLLLDFTAQMDTSSRISVSPSKEPGLRTFINSQRVPSPSKKGAQTPGRRNMLNLLDFDLPPQPTPRSIPTITIRELESMKSTYQSEISSLKASLSGREAEISSLKKAVNDALERIGEAQESLRDEKNAREYADSERMAWEKKGKEVENVLSSVREEYLLGEKEKDELQSRLEEAIRAKEEAEVRAAEATTKASVIGQTDLDSKSSTDATVTDSVIAQKVAQQLDEKMENLARELHSVYKKKHEAKVATLKKTYEARSDKKCTELQNRVDELFKQNEELQAAKDSNLSVEIPKDQDESDIQGVLRKQQTDMKEHEAKIAGLIEEMGAVKAAHAEVVKDLEQERVEKGELVAAVDEMLALQSEAGAPTAMEDFRKSIGKPSGLRTPGFESKIGRAGPGIPQRSLSGMGNSKSRMMSNIERMGAR